MSSSSDFSGVSHLDNCHSGKEMAEKPILLLVKFFLKNTHFYLGVCVTLIPIFFTLERTMLKFEHILKFFLTNPCLIFHGSLKTSTIFKPVGLMPCLYRKTEHIYFPTYSSSYYQALVHVKGQEMLILTEIK